MNELLTSLFDTSLPQSEIFKTQAEFIQDENFLIFSLTLQSSYKVRSEAKDIITFISSQNKGSLKIQTEILKQLLSVINKVLKLESSSGDQYFDLLAFILNP